MYLKNKNQNLGDERMRASELVSKLNQLIEEHGDLDVLYAYIDDEEENVTEVKFREFKCLSNDFLIL